ncbi:FAS1 domain-containing protein [Cladochytrium replicatum]|nr:FAS1 domain-containing protein [Cladochytrium replicatum]
MKFAALVATAFAALSAVNAQSILETLIANDNSQYNLTTLLTVAGVAKGVPEILNGTGPLTVFAPTNAAFATLFAAQPTLQATLLANNDLLVSVLQYHVVPGLAFTPPSTAATVIAKTAAPAPGLGSGATQNLVVKVTANPTAVSLSFGLGTAKVIGSITASNGIIHVVDTVLLAPQKISETAVAANLTEIVGALKAANLVSTVDSLVNTTVFVPTNAAFQAIKSVTATLTTAQLAGVLTYHVLATSFGSVFSPTVVTLANNTALDTLAKQTFTLGFNGSTPYLRGIGNTANVGLVTTDILVSNGVLHLIDAVLIPDVAKLPTQTSGNGTNSTATPTKTAGAMANSVSSVFALVIIAVCTIFMF